jgi:hypothetical protein
MPTSTGRSARGQTTCASTSFGVQRMFVTECLVPDRVEVVDLIDIVRWPKRKDARDFRARRSKHILMGVKIVRTPSCTISQKFHRDLVCRVSRIFTGSSEVLKTVEIIRLLAKLRFEVPTKIPILNQSAQGRRDLRGCRSSRAIYP